MQPQDFSKYDGFYALSDRVDRGSIFVEPVESALTFPYLQVQKNGPSTKEPITFIIKKNGKWKDLIFGGWPGLFLVSQRFHDILNSVSGLKFYSTLILDSKSKQINNSYFGLSATGRSGPIIREWYTEKVVTPGFLPVRKGLYFSLETWDKSDFFIPDNTAMIVVTEKIKKTIEQSGLTNVSFTRLSDLENYVF